MQVALLHLQRFQLTVNKKIDIMLGLAPLPSTKKLIVPLDVDGVLVDREQETLGLAARNVGTRIHSPAPGPVVAAAVAATR